MSCDGIELAASLYCAFQRQSRDSLSRFAHWGSFTDGAAVLAQSGLFRRSR